MSARNTPRRRLLTLTSATLALGLVAACSGGGDSSSS